MSDLTYYRCNICGNAWYLDAMLCRQCGASDFERPSLQGAGLLKAKTTVFRAPSKALQQFTPYTICLVRMDQGFVVGGHLAVNAGLGDKVKVCHTTFDHVDIPMFAQFEVENGA